MPCIDCDCAYKIFGTIFNIGKKFKRVEISNKKKFHHDICDSMLTSNPPADIQRYTNTQDIERLNDEIL